MPYFDPSAIIPILIPTEIFSRQVRQFLDQYNQPLFINNWQEAETKNALRAKFYRKEMTEPILVKALAQMEENFRSRLFLRRSVNWAVVFKTMEKISEEHTPKMGCRSGDLLHLALAQCHGDTEFYTFDRRQAETAAAVGLVCVGMK